MKTWLPLLLLCVIACSGRLQAQAPIYKPFEVDSAAMPRGGAAVLESFLAVNLRKPLAAQAANTSGRVYLEAIVEPDGQVSSVTVVRGLRPDCDSEAVRVMRLFNAWQPAYKQGQAVRQVVSYMVLFRPTPPIRYVDGQLIEYFDKDNKPTTDRQMARSQQAIPLDSITGLPTGDIILSEIRGDKIRETDRVPLVRQPTIPGTSKAVNRQLIGHRQADGKWFRHYYTVDSAGNVLNRQHPAGEQINYGKGGIVTYAKDIITGTSTTKAIMQWYPNGQRSKVQVLDVADSSGSDKERYRTISIWTSVGKVLLANGNGPVSLTSVVESRATPTTKVRFIETGTYVDGREHGRWMGRYSDDSYRYEEEYHNGKLLSGSASINQQKDVTYSVIEKNPEFEGGVNDLYAFLGRTIKYPSDAARAGIQGKVFLAFTINANGSVSDVGVLRGVDSSLDAEAMRVIKQSSGRWKPGLQRGEPVRVRYNLPISFQFQ